MDSGCNLIGWREWIALPQLGISHIKAKIDTGARTSVLHAFAVERYQENGETKVHFGIHVRQRSTKPVIMCNAKLVDVRWVKDSGGHCEQRYVIQTELILAGQSSLIEINLTNRDDMRFRVLLGRTALANRYWVNPAASYLTGKNPAQKS